jgi:hypothetical protein
LSPAPTSASITREHGGVTVIIRRWTATTAADRLQAAPHEVAEALLLRAAAVEVEEVDAVQRGVVAERVPDADAAEKGVPEVVGDVPGGGRGVVAAVDDGEEHGDLLLARWQCLTSAPTAEASWPERSVRYSPRPEIRRKEMRTVA